MIAPAGLDFRGVMALRREGRHADALAGARALMSADPDDVWHCRALCWCLISCAWDFAKAGDRETAARHTREARAALPEGEPLLDQSLHKLESAVLHDTRGLVAALKALAARTGQDRESPDPVVQNDALQLLRQYAEAVDQPVPGLTHSVVLHYAIRCLADAPEFLPFFRWWNPDSFRPEDFERYDKADAAKPLPSLVERALKALHAARTAAGPHASDQHEWIAAFFDRHAPRYGDNPYVGYYHGLLLADLGRHEAARERLRTVVRAQPDEFWTWAALAQACADRPDLAAACLCRALACPAHNPDFLVRVRARLASTWEQIGRPAEASREAATAVELRRRNGWSVPHDLADLANLPADPIDAEAYATTRAAFAAQADTLVTPLDTPGVVEHINAAKGIVAIAIGPGETALVRPDRLPAAATLKAGDTVLLAVERSPEAGSPARVLALVPAPTSAPSSFCRRIQGPFKSHPAGFGFVDEVFVPPDLAATCRVGGLVAGLALLTRKRRNTAELGWKLIRREA